MTAKTRSERETQPEGERAVMAFRRSIGRLVRLLGDDDLAVVHGAALALEALGGRAVVGPLAAALPGAPTPSHRAAIVGALYAFHRQEGPAVLRALIGAIRRETDPVLAIKIRAALAAVLAADLYPFRPPDRTNQTPRTGGDPGAPPTEDGS
jgi:hypothetical protein